MSYSRVAVVLDNHLYPDHDLLELDDDTLVFMAETEDMATRYHFHTHRVILYFSAMRHHAARLEKDYYVEYHRYDEEWFSQVLGDVLERYDVEEVVTYRPHDRFMREVMREEVGGRGVELTFVPSRSFLTRVDEFGDFADDNDLFMHDFYKWQRRRLDVLVDGGPEGGKWSFDQDNRESLPDDISIPDVPGVERDDIVEDVVDVVTDRLSDHAGEAGDFWLPTTRDAALEWKDVFFRERFDQFGPYQDAIAEDEDTVFHSVLSPLLNTGLLTPSEVVDDAVEAYRDGVRLQSVEGFIRQVIGWREFVKGVYETKNLQMNFFNHRRGLTEAWYTGETGLPPLDAAIRRVNRIGYTHHIERLMILSNAMLLCEIHPDFVYEWFMELFVDSADWVMEPNVYGMGQFADGGVFATKPYISGSNYILKMSNYNEGEWCDVWDGLYWRFIRENREFIRSNNRMGMMASMLDRLGDEKKERIFTAAEDFLEEYTV